MKKIIALLLVAAMAISVTACAKHTTPTVASKVSSDSLIDNTISSSASSVSTTSTVSSPSTAASASQSSKATSSSSVSKANTTSAGRTTTKNSAANGGSTPANNTAPAAKPSTNTPATTPTPAPAPAPTSSYKLVMPTSSQLASLSSQVLSLINAERARCGVPALRTESKLTQAAQMRATECSKDFPTYNGHMRPDGTLYATILNEVQYGTRRESQASKDGVHWYTEVDYDSGEGAENLTSAWYDPASFPNGFRATSAEYSVAAKKIFNDWKSSSGHYRNMISSKFTATGVGCAPVIKSDFMSIQCIQIFTEK